MTPTAQIYLEDIPSEEWRPVEGFGYEVSSFGRVRRVRDHRNVKSWVRPKDGYVLIGLTRNGKQRTKYLHRIVCAAFYGEAPTVDHEAAHQDGKRSNNSSSNLKWETSTENKADMIAHGTRLSGVNHPQAKLDEISVRNVFALRAEGLTLKQIASRVGIHFTTVSDILRRKIWREVSI